MKTRTAFSFAALAILLLLPVIAFISKTPPKELTKDGFALNTFISITIRGGDTETLTECFKIITEYENMLSRTLPASEVFKLNHTAGDYISVSPDIYALIEKSLEYSRKTSGLYDITVAPLSDLWDFSNRDINPVPPGDKVIKETLASVSYENIEIAPDNRVCLKNGAMIDLGSITKGYVADVLAEYLTAKGIDSALIDLGGDIYALGKKNKVDWKIGILEPFSENGDTIGYFEISDMSVVTSGTYQRYFEVDGKIYHHVLNPATGYPVNSGLISVSVTAKSAADADALSTACLLLGLDEGMALIETTPGAEAVFITNDGEYFYSSGIGSKAAYVRQR